MLANPIPGTPASVLAAVLATDPTHPPTGPRRATFSLSSFPDLPSLMNEVVWLPQYALLDCNGEFTGMVISLGWATKGVTAVTAAYTPLPSDALILVNAASGPVTVTLPDATAPGYSPGQRYTVKKTDSSANAVTVAASAGQLIDGAATVTLSATTSYVSVVFDGVNTAAWWTWAASSSPSGSPTGAAGGDLSGSYPNPSVAKIHGVSVPASPVAGQSLVATGAAAAAWAAAGGLQYLTGGGTITATTITSAQSAGFQGIFLDPAFVWDASGLVINGIQNFTVESRMAGSIGWLGHISYNTGGYIKTGTGSPADGVQVYSSSPASAQTQGVIFKNCVLVGANSNAVVHFGGGQRRCGLVDSLAYNTLSVSTTVAAGSNGTAVSSFTGTQALSVAATTGFPSGTGNVVVATSTGQAVLSFSGTGSGTLTNVTLVAGSGTLATGGTVQLAAFGAITDSALSPNNSEDMIFSFTGGGGIAGAFAAVGIGVGTTGSQAANDTAWYDLATSGGQFGIVKVNGGGQTFHNYYDRSSPALATVWNLGGARLTFVGGEDQNGTGQAHWVNGTSAQTLLINRTVTQFSTQTTTAQITAGSLVMRGPCTFNLAQTVALSGTGVLDLSDPAVTGGSATVSGSAGTLMLASNYAGPGSPPILTSWTGATAYQWPAVVASIRVTAQTTANTLSWTPPAVTGTRFRVSVYISVSVAGTSTVPVLAYHGIGSTTPSYTVPMWLGNSSAAAPSYTCAAVGEYFGTVEADTDGTASPVTLTVTPTGSTYRLSAVIERLT